MTKRDKKQFLYIIVFSIFVSFIEMIGVSAIMPFIAMANDSTYITNHTVLNHIYIFFHFTSSTNFIVYFGIFLVLFYIFRAGISMLYYYIVSKYARGKYDTLAKVLYKKILHLSYLKFVESKSTDYNKSIVNEAYNFTTIIVACLNIFTEFFVIIFIYGLMLYVETQLTLFITCILFITMFFLIKVVTQKIKAAGIDREVAQKSFFDIVQSTFGNYKLIKLSDLAQMNLNTKFQKASFNFTQSNITSETISQFPRVILELITFSILISIVIFLLFTTKGDITEKIPALTVLLLGLYRLMPSANRILTAYGQIIYAHRSLDIVFGMLNKQETETLGDEKISFKHSIVLKKLSFEYEHNKKILKDIDLTITKGQKVAFIGPSGSGKSTIIDIIIGLIPVEKSLYIDGVEINGENITSLRSKIGYIPQNVYLFDASVADNICLGKERNDYKIIDVLKKAKIYDFLINTKDGLETLVGDSGIKFSGGQKQRIAIARALYSDPDILVLDEATSALDEETEREIMEEIIDVSENKTLIIIAHRLNTIKSCDSIYEINNSQVRLVR